MNPGVGRRQAVFVLLLALFLGCAVPSSASPPLTAAAAQNLLDTWNPNYVKVVEFYGFFTPEGNNEKIAYVLVANPSDKNQRPAVYAAHFQLLTLPDNTQRWFLVSLVTHNAGLSRRVGWDNLMHQVKETPPGPAK
jgi:hypothetical protein